MFENYINQVLLPKRAQWLLLDCEYEFRKAIQYTLGNDFASLRQYFTKELKNAGFYVGGGVIRGTNKRKTNRLNG